MDRFPEGVGLADEYDCAACGETFAKDPGWSEADVMSEHLDRFGVPDGPVDVVCDECYRAMT